MSTPALPLEPGSLAGDQILLVIGGVATWEREIMLERQREGIAEAKAEGKYKGRAPTVAKQAGTIRARVAAGEKPARVVRELAAMVRTPFGADAGEPRCGRHSGVTPSSVGRSSLS
jgi:DNA invertase Pin-like site-specific DNA recombinase